MEREISDPRAATRRRWLAHLAFFSLCLGVLWQERALANPPCCELPSAEVQLEKPHENLSRFVHIDGLRSNVVYRATEQTGYYNHHPHLTRYKEKFFAAWSNHQADEDVGGQRVLLSESRNGERWSAPVLLFPPLQAEDGKGLVLTANGWLELDGTLFAIADLHEDIGWSNADGLVVSRIRSSSYHRPARKALGRLARQVNPDGTISAPFWVLRLDNARAVCKTCQLQPTLAAKVEVALRHPLNRRAWDFAEANKHGYWIDRYPVKAADGHRLVEPTTYRGSRHLLVRLLRDLDDSNFVYASVSSDGGKNWSAPRRTTIPDSPSRSFAGNLPDGEVFLIGNPVKGIRDPLAIRLSRNGVIFGKAMLVRRDSPPMRRTGRYKAAGFQYPSAVVAKNILWILYSVNKEDIEISQVPLQSLRSTYADK